MHKAFCKAFAAIRAESPPEYPLEMFDGGEHSDAVGSLERNIVFRELSAEMNELIERIGQRNMGKIANYLLFLEPRCLWCYRTKAHLGNDTGLTFCDTCSGASYCCTEHLKSGRSAHAEVRDEAGRTQVSHFSHFENDSELRCSILIGPITV